MAAGAPIDLRLNKRVLEGAEGTIRITALIKTFIEQGGNIMTLTVTDADELRRAMGNPEKYRSLRVRMGGWSAYFASLSKEAKKYTCAAWSMGCRVLDFKNREATMIRIAICDDENAETLYLSGLVKGWAIANGNMSIDIKCYPSAEAFLFAYDENNDDVNKADILMLDIQMGEMDGVTLAKHVRKTNKTVQIIFATSYMEYIADGYDVEALHYLIKPVSHEKLSTILDRAVSKLVQAERILLIQSSGQNIRLPLYEIRYIEVMHNYVTIHASGEFRVKKPLSILEQELDENFFRVGRSFIVNLRYVRKVSKDTVWLDGGQSVPLSRGLYDKLNRAIIDS